MKLIFLCVPLLFSALASVANALPSLEVLSFGSDHGSWPADNLCFTANSRFVAYQGGWILPHTCVGAQDTSSQVWFVKNGKAQKIGASAEGNNFTDVATDGQVIAFAEYNELGTLGLTLSNLGQSQTFKPPGNWPAMFMRDLNVISSNEIQFRILDENRAMVPGVLRAGQFSRLTPQGISYYFGATTSAQLRIEKVRVGSAGQTQDSQPDMIVAAVAPSFNAVVVARDHDADASSPITSFDNSIAVQGSRWAMLAASGQAPLLLRGDGARMQIVPLSALFKTVDHFMPAILSDGRVALRATDKSGQQGLWLVDLQNHATLLLPKGFPLSTARGSFVVGPEPFVTGPASSGSDVVIGVGLDDLLTNEPMEQDVVRIVP